MLFNMSNYLKIKRSILITKMHHNSSRYVVAELNEIDKMIEDIDFKARIQIIVEETIMEVLHEDSIEVSLAA